MTHRCKGLRLRNFHLIDTPSATFYFSSNLLWCVICTTINLFLLFFYVPCECFIGTQEAKTVEFIEIYQQRMRVKDDLPSCSWREMKQMAYCFSLSVYLSLSWVSSPLSLSLSSWWWSLSGKPFKAFFFFCTSFLFHQTKKESKEECKSTLEIKSDFTISFDPLQSFGSRRNREGKLCCVTRHTFCNSSEQREERTENREERTEGNRWDDEGMCVVSVNCIVITTDRDSVYYGFFFSSCSSFQRKPWRASLRKKREGSTQRKDMRDCLSPEELFGEREKAISSFLESLLYMHCSYTSKIHCFLPFLTWQPTKRLYWHWNILLILYPFVLVFSVYLMTEEGGGLKGSLAPN